MKPSYGVLLEAKGWKPAPGPDGTPRGAVELDGKLGIVKYKLPSFPEEDYAVSVWVLVTRMPATTYGQVFSAWAVGMDDPLRLVVHDKKLYARIEAGQAFSTEGFPLETGRWYHVVGVKRGPKLSLYVDGRLISMARAPGMVISRATEFAIGGNPNYSGPEFLAARLADLKFYARALSAEKVAALYRAARRER